MNKKNDRHACAICGKTFPNRNLVPGAAVRDVIAMAYTAHIDYSSADPPTFVVVGEQDGIAPPSSRERRIAALCSPGIEVENHRYRNLGHAFGPRTGRSAEGWIADAVRFREKYITQGN
jgi:acetyl esterase/lipase